MLVIKDLKAKLSDQDKQILKGIELTINPGETHILQGANGSGKSTLAAVLAGNPSFEITDGEIRLTEENYPEHIQEKLSGHFDLDGLVINELGPDLRSIAGIFLAHQYPLEIPGVDLINFLRMSFNQHQEKDMPVFKFRKYLKEKAELINYPDALLERNLNEGFSGGEKKKTEILQLAVLNPRYVILDETDSGLDKQAIHDVFTGIQKIREQNKEMAVLVITHYERVLEYLKTDYVHTMENGKIIETVKSS